MSRTIVPLQPVPNQTLQCQLGGQACVLNVYQTAFALFVNLWVGNRLVQAGVIALNQVRIVRSSYLGFSGDLAFVDQQGDEDPVYTGLGGRFQLLYFEPQDLPAGEG